MLGLRTSHNRSSRLSWPDLAAGAILLGACSLGALLTWGRLADPVVDPGWHLQVASRVAAGDVLYRDAIWMYGPLPVYLLALLFRWLGTQVTPLLVLYQLLAVAGCLLTYRIARFLLAPPLALLGTLALLLGGWWAGFVGYTQAYTLAVPLGGVLGLLFVLSLLSYLRTREALWLVGAGLATGAAALTKPEFAVACAGTGLLILTALALFPQSLAGQGDGEPRALAIYALSAGAVAAAGYGLLAWQAGWRHVWAGATGYDQDAILLREWPPWGTEEAWLYIVSGLGVYLFMAAILAASADPARARKHPLALALAAGLGLALAVLPWRSLAHLNPGLIASMRASSAALAEQAIRVFWAPGTLLLTLLLLALGILWIRAHRRRQPLDLRVGYLAVLALYSALAALRSYLYPTGTFHFMYLPTLFPVLVFLAAVSLPAAVERHWEGTAASSRVQALVALAMLGYAAAGLVWDLDYYAWLDGEWVSPRGAVRYNTSIERNRARQELLQFLLAYVEPGDPIAVLGQEPGFYFWTGARNPLRQDTLVPGMAASAADAREMVRRLAGDAPRLIAVPQGVIYGRGWFWELEAGRQAYQDLAPVWQHIEDQYEFRQLVGGERWGYAIYEPPASAP